MNWAATLNAEIAKKRKALDSSSGPDGEKTKYVKRSDLERAREEEYRKKEKERLAKETEKKEQKRREEEALSQERDRKLEEKREESQSKKDENVQAFSISEEEVVRRLRAKGEPIRLFAEADKDRKIRLRALELMESEEKSQQNDFMRKMKKVEKDMDDDMLKQKGGILEERKKKDTELRVTPISLKQKHQDRSMLYIQIYAYFSHTLEEWEETLNARSEEIKRSGPGKQDAIKQKQTAEYLRPLFRLLKKGKLEPDILARVTEIAHFMQNRRYADAHSSYMKLSIGNATWPIGVTMVGIHERTARENISSSKVAHALNDEPTRKWIQSLKRLMTFAQSKYPPELLNQMS